MDTSLLENIAEDLVSHRLQQAKILVAKPKFDQQGTDLLAFLNMADGVKFCRIQCKGRSLLSGQAQISIPTRYVSKGFLVFLYIDGLDYSGTLYCFFAHDIEAWTRNEKDEYFLSIPERSYREKFAAHAFDSGKIELIKTLIQQADVNGEFRYLSHLSGNVVLEDVSVSGGFIGYVPSGA